MLVFAFREMFERENERLAGQVYFEGVVGKWLGGSEGGVGGGEEGGAGRGLMEESGFGFRRAPRASSDSSEGYASLSDDAIVN
jgi:hypothetical protein